LEIIEAMPIREQVANILRKKIIDGDFSSNERISERQIGEMLNVSTTPVKEAIRSLVAEGFVYTIPRKGSFVSEHSKENIREIIFVRSAIDGVAAYFAALYASNEQISYMRECLKGAREIIERQGDKGEISRLNSEFHQTVRQSCPNSFIVNLGNSIFQIDMSVRTFVNQGDYEELMGRQLQHEKILEAIETKNSERAEELMRIHVRTGSSRAFK
jgi:DNA-binding GntR family transcriptional regulator